jgi:hypothetical protein
MGGGVHQRLVGTRIENLKAEVFETKNVNDVAPLAAHLQMGLHGFRYTRNKQFILNYVHQLLGNERWAVRWDEPYAASDYKIKNYRLEFTFVAHLKEF